MQNKATKNICRREKVIIWLTFKLGLALTGFRTLLPCFQQVNHTRARDPTENQHLVNFKKTLDLGEF